MSKVLLGWELGAGLGHMVPLAALARRLTERGHRVHVALRDLSRARSVFGDGVRYLQAPYRPRAPDSEIKGARTLAHVLHNMGFHDEAELRTLAEAWRNLFRLVRPDLAVFDHSPSGLLAARGLPMRTAVIGTGFFIPPDVCPLPDLRTWNKGDPDTIRADEQRVLANANAVLARWRQPLLASLAKLYAEADERFLITFPELDHYDARDRSRYWGYWTKSEGKAPAWPDGSGKRVYAYLKPFAALPDLLRRLNELGLPTLVTADRIDLKTQEEFSSPTLRFEPERLDHTLVARECDLAILNANHGTLVHMLLAGKPVLNVPLFLEQGVLAGRVVRMGAGVQAPSDDGAAITRQLDVLLSADAHARAAQRFAERYQTYNAERHWDQMTSRLEALLAAKDGAVKLADVKLPVIRSIFADHAPAAAVTTPPRPTVRGTTQAIPRIRHLIWLGGPMAERHVEWRKSWERHMPDWEIRVWDDAAVADLPIVATDMWKTATSLAQRADLLRYWLVGEFGGVYADTDVQCLRPLDPLLFSKPITCFVGEEKPTRICNAVMGAVPHHPFIVQLNERIKGNWFQHADILNRSANFFLMRVLRDFHGPGNVNVFPPRFFYPYLWGEKDKYPGRTDFEGAFPDSYLVHHWDASWQTPSRPKGEGEGTEPKGRINIGYCDGHVEIKRHDNDAQPPHDQDLKQVLHRRLTGQGAPPPPSPPRATDGRRGRFSCGYFHKIGIGVNALKLRFFACASLLIALMRSM